MPSKAKTSRNNLDPSTTTTGMKSIRRAGLGWRSYLGKSFKNTKQRTISESTIGSRANTLLPRISGNFPFSLKKRITSSKATWSKKSRNRPAKKKGTSQMSWVRPSRTTYKTGRICTLRTWRRREIFWGKPTKKRESDFSFCYQVKFRKYNNRMEYRKNQPSITTLHTIHDK